MYPFTRRQDCFSSSIRTGGGERPARMAGRLFFGGADDTLLVQSCDLPPFGSKEAPPPAAAFGFSGGDSKGGASYQVAGFLGGIYY